jgi:hypothetical protein
VRPHGELVQPGDQVIGGDDLVGPALAVPEIVDAEQDDDVRHPRLRQHVAVEAAQAAVAVAVVEQPAAAGALIHHTQLAPAVPRDEPPRELVGPAVVRVQL